MRVRHRPEETRRSQRDGYGLVTRTSWRPSRCSRRSAAVRTPPSRSPASRYETARSPDATFATAPSRAPMCGTNLCLQMTSSPVSYRPDRRATQGASARREFRASWVRSGRRGCRANGGCRVSRLTRSSSSRANSTATARKRRLRNARLASLRSVEAQVCLASATASRSTRRTRWTTVPGGVPRRRRTRALPSRSVGAYAICAKVG